MDFAEMTEHHVEVDQAVEPVYVRMVRFCRSTVDGNPTSRNPNIIIFPPWKLMLSYPRLRHALDACKPASKHIRERGCDDQHPCKASGDQVGDRQWLTYKLVRLPQLAVVGFERPEACHHQSLQIRLTTLQFIQISQSLWIFARPSTWRLPEPG